ncbi:MAG: hypothetical protein QNK79_02520 [Synechococcus sp. ArSW.bin.68]|jgi:hypothetical protein
MQSRALTLSNVGAFNPVSGLTAGQLGAQITDWEQVRELSRP